MDHTADIKFRVYGKTVKEIFQNSVLAFNEYICRGQKIENKEKKVVNVEGEDLESLFYNFLDELIYLIDAENFIVTRAKINIMGFKINAELMGDKTTNYKDLDHIKAATYSEMYIKKIKSGWEAQAVLDV